jgi:hypothetical protein
MAEPAPRFPARRLIAPAIANVVLQVLLVAGDRVPSIDTLAYLESGTNLLQGDGFRRYGVTEVHFPPIPPLGLGGLHLLLGDEMAAVRTWNLLWGLALVAVVVALTWRISRDVGATVLSAWTMPAIGGGVSLLIRGGGGSEAPAAVLVLCAALALLRLLDLPPPLPVRQAVTAGLGAGALVGLAYLVRPEALGWGLLALAATAVHAWRARRPHPATTLVRPLAALSIGFLVAASCFIVPWAVRQHGETGSWSITSKSREASIETWADLAAGDRADRDAVLHEIQPDGTTLGPPLQSLGSLAREDPGGWLAIVATNAAQIAQFYLLWQLVLIVVLVPAVVRLWRTRSSAATLVLGAVAAGPVLTSLVYFALPRYLVVTTAVLVAYGCWGLAEWWRTLPARWSRPALAGYGVALTLSLVVAAWPLLPGSPSPERTDQMAAGRWVAENLPDDAVVLTRSYVAQHYAERPVVTLPVGELDEIIEFGIARGATHLIADETTLRGRRPDLVDDLLGPTTPPDLELLHEDEVDGRTIRIFALPPTTQPPWPLPLGYVSDPVIPRP